MRSAGLLGVILIAVLSNSPALAKDDSYLCVAESAVGFSFNKTSKNWEQANFKAENKYLVSKSSEASKEWEVKKIGESSGTDCPGGFDQYGFIRCEGLLDFRMNNKSLRYIVVHPYGYVVKEYPKSGLLQEGSITPYIEIGKYSPL
jgi:hypothetical protein